MHAQLENYGSIWLESRVRWNGSILNYRDGLYALCLVRGTESLHFLFGWRDEDQPALVLLTPILWGPPVMHWYFHPHLSFLRAAAAAACLKVFNTGKKKIRSLAINTKFQKIRFNFLKQ